ncbi:MAG: hypothetical protein Q7J98_12080 [Kiritimatiellia bacterium]|nr:hypothetical protein [Kiritimatiellia bacterium]
MNKGKYTLLLYCCALFILHAAFTPANAAVSAYRYRGGSGDGWDSRQASPAMYCGGAGAGNSMNVSSNVLLSDLSDYPRSMTLLGGANEQLVHWYIYDITQVYDYDRTQPYGVHWFTDLSVKCSSGWEEADLSQVPQTAWLIPPREYAVGIYTTTWYHADFYDKRIVFAVDSNEVRNFVYMDPRWTSPCRVLAAITSEGTNYLVNAWLEGTSGSPATDSGNCRVSIVDASASEIASASQASPNGSGFFRLPIDISSITNNNTYLANIGIDDFNGNSFSNTITFGLSGEADSSRLAEILSNTIEIIGQTEGIRSNTTWLGTSYEALSASFSTLNPKIDTIGIKMDASLAGIDSIQTAVGASESETLYSKVADLPAAITREAKKGVQSKIINRPTSATNGASLMIRYKTDTGKVPTINVYDPDAGNLVSDGIMTEINATGVYEYNLNLLSTWPLGEYMIICSESTTASADSMTLKVVSPEAIVVDLSSVTTLLEALGVQLSGVAADQSTMNSTLTTMSNDINTLLENWNSLNMADLKATIDLLVKYTGTPNDSGGMQTLFGKIAKTYGLVNQMPVAAVFAEIQSLRQEVDFQGKSDTTYSMLADISSAIDDLQVAGTDKTKETSTELLEASQTVIETREALGAIAKQAGLGNVIAVSAAGGKALSLQSLYDQMTELKALSQAIYDLLLQREKPVVKSWLESGSVKQRILVANNSKAVEEVVPVKEYLPEGVKPKDIISKGDFNLGYDFDRSLYYVHQEIKLAPGANVTLEVVMNDIWWIDEAEISMLRYHVKRLATILEPSRYANQVKVLRENIDRRLDRIIEVQKTVTTTESRLSNYEMNKVALEDIKIDIGSLEDLVVEVQGLPTDTIMGEISPLSAAAGLAEVQRPKKKIKLKIEMVNPLAISNTAPLEYRLPAEIMPNLIADMGGLEVRYDPEKKLHYLSAPNLAFAPHEKKSFAVELNDVWYIPDQQINDLRGHTAKLVGMFAGSEALPAAEFLGKRVTQALADIDKSQQQTDLTADVHIGNCRLNAQRMEEIKKDIARLERLIVQTGGTPGLTMAKRDVKIKEGGVIPAAGSKAKLLGTVNTWRIIWTIIIFAGIISVVFFMIWWMQIMKKDAIKLQKLEKLDTVGKDKK